MWRCERIYRWSRIWYNVFCDVSVDESGYKFLVYEGNNELSLEGYFCAIGDDKNYDFFDSKITVSADYTSDGHGSYANIYLSECFEETICGLSGVWDGDTANDFTYVDIQLNVQNEDGSIYTTENVSDVFALANDYDLLQSTQEFGFEWTDTYMIVAIEQDQDNCYVVSDLEQPNFKCLESAIYWMYM